MILIMPASLRPFNIPVLSGAVELVQPVTQLGRASSAQDAAYWVDGRIAESRFLHVIEQAAREGLPITLVCGGGRTVEERRAAAAFAFLPTSELAKVEVDKLVELSKLEQVARQSNSAPVRPERRGFDVYKGRPNAQPVLELAETPESEGEADDAGDDGGVE